MMDAMFPGAVCSSHAARFLMVVGCSTMLPDADFVVKDQSGVLMETLTSAA
jgi:hypothetical protein